MDMTAARTEPFVEFLEFHDAFSQQYKASVTALALVVNGAPAIRDAFVEKMPSHWRAHHDWSDVSSVVGRCLVDTNRLAIVQVHSALDDFLVALRASHDRWREKVNTRIPRWKGDSGDPDEPLWKAATGLGLDATDLLRWQPLLSYFRVMRNCIVHASSRASDELVQRSTAAALDRLLAAWPKRPRTTAPRIPEFRSNRPIKISHKDVILCLDAARRACSSINANLLAFLGTAGMVHAAAHFSVLDKKLTTLRTGYRTAARAIGHTLEYRYNVRGSKHTLDTELRRLHILERCKTRHSELYRQSIEQGAFKTPHGFKLP
jgi:hypothetical protein